VVAIEAGVYSTLNRSRCTGRRWRRKRRCSGLSNPDTLITTTITTAVNLSPPSSLSFPKLCHRCKVTLYAWVEAWAEPRGGGVGKELVVIYYCCCCYYHCYYYYLFRILYKRNLSHAPLRKVLLLLSQLEALDSVKSWQISCRFNQLIITQYYGNKAQT